MRESKSKSLESRLYLDPLEQAVAYKGTKWPLPMSTSSSSVPRRVRVQFTENTTVKVRFAAVLR